MKFYPFENQWSMLEWQEKCPEMTYKVVSRNELPDWLPKTLIDKFNCGVFAASGNTQTYVGIVMGYRIDKNQIDEHPFVVAFDKQTQAEYSGIIDHGNWMPGRTTEMPIRMQQLISASGLTVNFQFERKPTMNQGTLEDLKRQGILNGFETAVAQIEKKRMGDVCIISQFEIRPEEAI